MLTLAIGVPPSSHFIYIPAIFLLGIVLGFIFGSKAVKDQIALAERQAAERDARRAAREARNAATPDKPAASKP